MTEAALPAATRKRGRPRKGTEPLAKVDHVAVLERYLKDEKASVIAASLGVHLSALHQFLLKHHEEEWRTAQVARALTQWEKAKEKIGQSRDQLSLARAREELKSAQWDLERLLSRLFGQKGPSITINTTNVDQAVIVSASDLLETVAQKRHAAVLPLDQAGEDTVSGE